MSRFFFMINFCFKISLIHDDKNSQGKGKEKSNVGQNSDNYWNGGEVMNCFLVT